MVLLTRAGRQGLLVDLLERDGDGRVGVERQRAGHALVEHDAERVQVARSR